MISPVSSGLSTPPQQGSLFNKQPVGQQKSQQPHNLTPDNLYSILEIKRIPTIQVTPFTPDAL